MGRAHKAEVGADQFNGLAGVTVNLQLRRFGNAPLGAWVQIETEARQQLGDLIFIDGRFTVDGQALADFSGIWKGMGKKANVQTCKG